MYILILLLPLSLMLLLLELLFLLLLLSFVLFLLLSSQSLPLFTLFHCLATTGFIATVKDIRKLNEWVLSSLPSSSSSSSSLVDQATSTPGMRFNDAVSTAAVTQR
jgi:hypothetical protein